MQINLIPIDLIVPHPALRKLALLRPSAEEISLLQKIGLTNLVTVRATKEGDNLRYELLSGITTWVAAPIIGLHEINAAIIEADDITAEEMINQIQEVTTSNNPLKKARALKTILEQNIGLSQKELGFTIGEKNYNISHYLRLLKLPKTIQEMIESGRIPYGQARSLLALEKEKEKLLLAEQIDKRSLSARVVEKVVKIILVEGIQVNEAIGKALKKQNKQEKAVSSNDVCDDKTSKKKQKDPNIVKLEERIAEKLGTTVEIEYTPGAQGYLKINYENLDILDGVIEQIEGVGQGGRNESEYEW